MSHAMPASVGRQVLKLIALAAVVTATLPMPALAAVDAPSHPAPRVVLTGVPETPITPGTRASLTATIGDCFGGCTFTWYVDEVPVAATLVEGPGEVAFVAVASVDLDLAAGRHAVAVRASDEHASRWATSRVIIVRAPMPETATVGDDAPILLFAIAAVLAAASLLARPTRSTRDPRHTRSRVRPA